MNNPLLEKSDGESMLNDCLEIKRILISSLNTAKKNKKWALKNSPHNREGWIISILRNLLRNRHKDWFHRQILRQTFHS